MYGWECFFPEFVPPPADTSWDVGGECDPSWDVVGECFFPEFVPPPADLS